jgi:hypothetical protein
LQKSSKIFERIFRKIRDAIASVRTVNEGRFLNET